MHSMQDTHKLYIRPEDKFVELPVSPAITKFGIQKAKNGCNLSGVEEKSCDVHTEFCDVDGIYTSALPVLEDCNSFKCPECENISTSLTDLDTHLLSHGNKLYNCVLCNLKFTSDKYLKDHLLDHNETVRIFKCSECEFVTESRGTFLTHALIHINLKPHKCTFCGICFRTHSHLKNHERRHTGEKPYCCTKCDYRASGRNALKAHMLTKVHNNIKPFYCSTCSSNFNSRKSLQDHLRSHSEERPFSCSICEKSFKTNFSLKSHLIFHKQDFYYCSHCEFRTKYKNNLKTHEKSHTGNDGHKKFHCHICSLRTGSKNNLKNHLESHGEERAYKCSYCNYRGKTKSALYSHERRHTNYFVSCSVCQKRYTNRKSLKYHYLKSHTIERPFKCPKCNYATVQNKLLRLHIMKHTGETPIKCEICEKGFRTTSNLTKHRKAIHIKYKLFKCPLCDHHSKFEGNMKIHIKRVHNKEKEFKCDICPQSYASKNTLKAHLVQHSGLRPYHCHLCSYAGIEERCLRAHLLTHGKTNKKGVYKKAGPDLKCSICPFSARGKVNFRKHLLLHVKKCYVQLFRLPM